MRTAGAVLLFAVAQAGAATFGPTAKQLPTQFWGVSLAQPASASVLANARRGGVNALIIDRAATDGAGRATLRRNAAAARLAVYEPVHVGVSLEAGRAACRRAHDAAQPCLLFAPSTGALASLARVAGVDALVIRGIVFKDNTWRPNNANSTYPYSGLRTECEPPAGVAPTQVIGNDFQLGPQPADCARLKAAPFDTVWKNNTFRLGRPCTS